MCIKACTANKVLMCELSKWQTWLLWIFLIILITKKNPIHILLFLSHAKHTKETFLLQFLYLVPFHLFQKGAVYQIQRTDLQFMNNVKQSKQIAIFESVKFNVQLCPICLLCLEFHRLFAWTLFHAQHPHLCILSVEPFWWAAEKSGAELGGDLLASALQTHHLWSRPVSWSRWDENVHTQRTRTVGNW